jgi:hypothetical protein
VIKFIIIIFTGLHLWCWAYAFLLNLRIVHDWYYPDRIWVTVVFGNGFIVGALYLLEFWGVALNAWLVLYANMVAGVPIILWQVSQQAENRGARDEMEGGPHDRSPHVRRR